MSTFTPFTAPSPSSQPKITPRIIIHGGAGNITRTTISKARYDAYQASLRRILASSAELLSKPGATALDVATHAVSMLEDDPLYNSGKGAVFTRTGTQELESSIMVSNGYVKRGVGCMLLQRVKNPIKLARELLIRGEEENGGGAKDHCQYSGPYLEELAKDWGIDLVDTEYFFTQRKWDEHIRGLKEEEKKKRKEEHKLKFQEERRRKDLELEKLTVLQVTNSIDHIQVNSNDWEKSHYIPLGTCGAVVLDSFGTVCCATSTGGLTNKIPGRIGDTPTMGAGYWAEEWLEKTPTPTATPNLIPQTQAQTQMLYQPSPSPSALALDKLSRGDLRGLMSHCLPTVSPSILTPAYTPIPASTPSASPAEKSSSIRHAVGVSSSGNGDTFVRMAAARTVVAESRFSSIPLSEALSNMTGPGGELQRSARDRWGHAHEGVGGMIGIELVGNRGTVVCDYNCGGMFRAWTEEDGAQKCLIFREDSYESGPKEWREEEREEDGGDSW
ncbi:L-asparaginase precursor [Lindgomyces ingoldianus]|uniref:L-asparaginase n=1 Tax=Lindgomyces ingoldianus TaxID=673940 RepID=A0ACB6QZJ8_9PLEO|nr:L-asparaginase precursor [Lindgomyces ingoldianus]KAF2472464.1 L-asparaginase precursor [Lindgomyces ingoldianus]